MMMKKVKNNLKEEEMSGSKINPKVQSANEAMIAEMLIEEIEKLSEFYNRVIYNQHKLENQYLKVEEVLTKNQESVNSFFLYIQKHNEHINVYKALGLKAMKLSEELVDISKIGIGIKEESKEKIYERANAGIKPIKEYLKWLTYGMGLAFFLLLITLLLMTLLFL